MCVLEIEVRTYFSRPGAKIHKFVHHIVFGKVQASPSGFLLWAEIARAVPGEAGLSDQVENNKPPRVRGKAAF